VGTVRLLPVGSVPSETEGFFAVVVLGGFGCKWMGGFDGVDVVGDWVSCVAGFRGYDGWSAEDVYLLCERLWCNLSGLWRGRKVGEWELFSL